ncbi:hypothetical protein TNCV_4860321 [Trichonephila clavipes]|nr:hypothetical protein TNCV_4860321 [Trichonephila clavipes]
MSPKSEKVVMIANCLGKSGGKFYVSGSEVDEIVTSVQEKSDPVDDETDEDEDNNNDESGKGSSNADAFSALETAMECYKH